MNNSIWLNLINWSKRNHSHLPWREKRSLYHTLVSEIMLQQTTVSTVIPRFEKFIKKFPDISTLAEASEKEVLKSWEGLGYYSRARRLHGASKVICDLEYFPEKFDELISIKGIGEYTANALLSIGMEKKELSLDSNLIRVLARFFGINNTKENCKKILYEKFNDKKILNLKNISFRALNESIMDLGRVYCQARKTDCLLCPLRKECVSFENNNQLLIPIIEKKKKVKKINLDVLRVLNVKNDKILFFTRPKGKWLEGQLELPSFVFNNSTINQFPRISGIEFTGLPFVSSTITKYKIKNHIIKDQKISFDQDSAIWISKTNIENYSITSVSKKILSRFL